MAEEILVKEILTAEEITAGEELLKRLDRSQAEIFAAYWVYVSAITEWHLEFVSPQVESEGPLDFYRKVNNLLSYPPEIYYLTLNTIMVLGPNYSFYKLLRSALKPKKDLSGVRLNHYIVGNDLVDLYIYRFPAKDFPTTHTKSRSGGR
jgi:hypothetical protein